MNRLYDPPEDDGSLGSDSDDLQLNSRMAAMNLELNISWLFSEGDLQLNPRMSAKNHRYNTSWWASDGDGPLGYGPDNPQLKSQIAILQRLCENGPLYAVEVRYGGRKYGKVEVKDGRILINSFQTKEPKYSTKTRFIPLPELLSRFNKGSNELPKTIFLRMVRFYEFNWREPTDDGEESFDVIIDTDGIQPRAKNCILLCSALKGPSYKGCVMCYYPSHYGMYVRPPDEVLEDDANAGRCWYFPDVRSAPPIVVKGIREDDSMTPAKVGGVHGMSGKSSFIDIQLNLDDQRLRYEIYGYHLPVHNFGVVVEGLQSLKKLRRGNCSIEECGLVI